MEDPIAPTPVPQRKQDFSGTEGEYLLPHHAEEVQRLRRQHNFIKHSTGEQLTHVKLSPGARVLDSGCSDGTWLADLGGLSSGGDESGSSGLSLHGADIGGALFRSHPHLDLREHDIRQPFPAEWGWQSSFDLVHQRLLVWGIGADEWDPVVKNLCDAVRPGGSIQLVEGQWVLPSYAAELVQAKKLGKVQEWSGGMDVHVWRRFPDLLRASGMINVQVEDFQLGYGAAAVLPEDRSWSAELLFQSLRYLPVPPEGIPGVAASKEEYLAFLDQLLVEMKTLGYVPILKWTTAQKPAA